MSMSSVQWLNLNRVKLHEIPEEIGKLGKLVCINYINICFFLCCLCPGLGSITDTIVSCIMIYNFKVIFFCQKIQDTITVNICTE